MIIKVMKIWSQ